MIDFTFLLGPRPDFNPSWLGELYRKFVVRSPAVGKDGVRQRVFAANLGSECELISRKVVGGSYKFTNYREKLIARGAARQPRQISIPTIRDRLALRAVLEFLKVSFPDAKPAPPHRYIKEIKEHLSSVRGDSSFLRMDIRDFFPSIRHEILRDILRSSSLPSHAVDLVMKAIQTRTGGMEQAAPRIGIPQGLSISNALAAIYMLKFDQSIPKGVFYRRYVDDILIIAPTEKIFDLYNYLSSGLADLGLESHPLGTLGKTEAVKIADGIQYLGYHVAPDQISVREASLGKMFANLSRVITSLKYKKNETDRHLFRLNLKISGCIIGGARRGWLMFFSQTDNVSQLAYLDAWLEREIKSIRIDYRLCKTFKKAYYEIKYNLKNTDYIINFDKFNLPQKKEIIVLLSNRSAEAVEAMDVEAIELEFSRLIGKEITELERDLIEAFS